MQKLVVASALILGISGTAQAGLFDSVFGDKSPAEEKVASAADTGKSPTTSSMADSAMNMAAGLIPTLTQQLGVTETQAQGGMGSLLGMAKQSLSSGEFEQLGAGVPGVETLLTAAPALSGGKASGLGGMLSGAGGLASSIGGMAQLTEQFEALGLSPDMIAQFANIAVQYFSQGGNSTGALLEKGLGSILG